MAKEVKDVGEATIKERTVTYLRRREGEHVTTAELSNALGIKRDQATSALHNLAKRSLPDAVSRVGDGVWVYVSPRTRRVQDATTAQLGEIGEGLRLYLLGRLPGSDGMVMIAADDDGIMYEVRRLESLDEPIMMDLRGPIPKELVEE